MRASNIAGAARQAALILIIGLSVAALVGLALTAAFIVAADRAMSRAVDVVMRLAGCDRDDFPLTIVRRG